ncbi:MAG: hypothetical protein JW827_12395 [Spirochaetes bacterium]|nr:hypothetical protein [Spirochaetota bacterium]
MGKKVLPLGQLLIKEKKINEKQLARALENQRKTGDRLGHTLINLGFISEDELIQVLEHQFGIPCIKINTKILKANVIKLIPENICRKYRLIPLLIDENKLTVAATDPYNLKFIDEIKLTTDYNVDVVLCSEKSVMDAINVSYGKKNYNYVDDDSSQLKEGVSVAKIIDMILLQAYHLKANEVQLEFLDNKFNIQFISKVHHLKRSQMPSEYYNNIAIRLKNLAGLDTTQKNQFLEGLFSKEILKNKMMVRLLIFPHPKGENIVLKFS